MANFVRVILQLDMKCSSLVGSFRYLTIITVLGLAGIIGPFFPKFHEPELLCMGNIILSLVVSHLLLSDVRTFLFFGLGAIGIIPTIHIR